MMSAKEAKTRALLQTAYKNYKNTIEKAIEKAVSDGYLFAKIPICFKNKENEKEIVEIISGELELLGYRTQYEPEKPLPPGYPSDQWDYYSYFYVSWED